MIIKALAVAGGLAGAAGLSQFPEYSQQYMQRLSGAVDELAGVVARFDADAAGLGLTREAALVDLSKGGKMGQARALSMGYVLERHDRLTDDLARISSSTVLGKMMNLNHFTDPDLIRKTWADFKPAVPVTADGLSLVLIGFATGYGVLIAVLGGLKRLVRRRPAQTHAA